MSDENQTTAIETSIPATVVAVPVVKTKEERIAAIDAHIAKLNEKRLAILEDREVKSTAKVVYVPEVGDKVLVTYGRNTPTTQAKIVPGTVKAVKLGTTGDDGKKSPTQVRVAVFEGEFDEQLITKYPAELTPVPVEALADEAVSE